MAIETDEALLGSNGSTAYLLLVLAGDPDLREAAYTGTAALAVHG